MKKLFSAFILCTVLLCGCSAKGGEEISETDVPETSSVTVSTENSAETTTTITTATTAKETTVTEPAEEKIILTPIPSKEPFEIPYCRIIDYWAIDSEENFRSGEAIKRAREICFEKARKEIELYNDNYEYAVETAEDIVFSCGLAYDFDNDGSDEYVIALDYAPLSPMNGGFLILMDGSEYTVDTIDCGDISAAQLKIIFCENLYFPMVNVGGATWELTYVYSFENNKPQKALECQPHPHSIIYENGIFYLIYKGEYIFYPFVLCGDGVFRQLGREKITREDFEAHVRDGGRYIDSLAEKGYEVTDIYTCGYCNYQLCGEDFCYEVYSPLFGENKGKFLAKRSDDVPDESDFIGFTDEVVYGDVWAVQATRSLDYDIGGGYICYKTGKSGSRILNVVKDNVITDSINLSDENLSFDPDCHINFYDIDTPPCFALETSSWGIDYRTYFVIDGKITEMNWTLDGEPLDTIDYTMLQCRGEGDEFVSYSIPIWEDDRFTKRHFTFADGNYTNIVGYTEDIEDKITKEYNDNLHGYVKHGTQLLDNVQNAKIAYEIIRKFDVFWGNAYNAERSYDEDYLFLDRIEKEGFRTKEEIMNTLSEFCTPAASEEVYSELVESRYSDFKIIDGRFYLYDGPPSNYLPYYFIESAEEKDSVITAKIFSYYSGQDRPYWICPPLYAEFVREDGVWKISSLPKEKQAVTP
ncbi:MAG: hypothetical protein K2H23_00420 [Oscillospiraceae bacterium]|nr:hypothetical protein [Oscillospiraceae bacterium]